MPPIHAIVVNIKFSREAVPQKTGAGLEEAAAAFVAGWRARLPLRLQVCQICLAVGAADRLQVKRDVIMVIGFQDAQEIAPQLGARRTGEPIAPPDRSDGMVAAVAFLHELAQLLARHPIGAGPARPGRFRHRSGHLPGSSSIARASGSLSSNRSRRLQFRKHVGRQAGGARPLVDFLDCREANIGHLLFADSQKRRDIPVGPGLDE